MARRRRPPARGPRPRLPSSRPVPADAEGAAAGVDPAQVVTVWSQLTTVGRTRTRNFVDLRSGPRESRTPDPLIKSCVGGVSNGHHWHLSARIFAGEHVAVVSDGARYFRSGGDQSVTKRTSLEREFSEVPSPRRTPLRPKGPLPRLRANGPIMEVAPAGRS